MKKYRYWLIAGLAAFLGAAGLWWLATPAWPVFPADQSSDPQVIVQMDRDYAYHTGDLIPVDLFVRQKPNTRVEPSTLAVDGDFELASPPRIDRKELSDGSICYRLRLKLQSFQVKPEVVLKSTVGWSGGDSRTLLVVPAVSFHTSNTYDGRKKLKEGDDPRVTFYWYGGRHLIALSAASLVFVGLCVIALRTYLLSLPKPQIDLARNRALELLVLVQSGACSKEEHLELDGLMRERFGVGPIPPDRLDRAQFAPGLVDFLKLNAEAIYAQDPLNDESRTELRKLGDGLLASSTWQQLPKSPA